MTPDKQSKINFMSDKIRRIIFITVIVLLIIAFLVPLAVGY